MFSSSPAQAPAPPPPDVTLVPLAAHAKAQGVSPGSLARRARRGQLEGATLIASRWYVADAAPTATVAAVEVQTDPGLRIPEPPV
ncbi:hypothetical protein [Oryzihumus sp.]|jgi:hypothetical protein|uniref:hypothetical protein n=1 Tax=Oryzihumus sp. TaxID=1968903 RepID=UPI002EDBB640